VEEKIERHVVWNKNQRIRTKAIIEKGSFSVGGGKHGIRKKKRQEETFCGGKSVKNWELRESKCSACMSVLRRRRKTKTMTHSSCR
jgi:hypothetical protein